MQHSASLAQAGPVHGARRGVDIFRSGVFIRAMTVLALMAALILALFASHGYGAGRSAPSQVVSRR